MRRLIIILHFVFFGSAVIAQERPGVKLLAKSKDQAILLRWAPTNSFTWLQGNLKGYHIERYTISRKKEILRKPEKILLTSSPLKPRPVNQWKSDAEKNKYSAIAAQSIYGSTFQVQLSQNGSLGEVVNRSKEQEQRFSFALFAADHSFQTAKLSGLGFKDSTVKKDERYLYRVYLASADSKVKLDTGLFYLGLQDTVGLIPPVNLTAQFADRQVLLKWPKAFVQQTYTSFIIERSEAGGEFVRRNSSPYINSASDPEVETFFQVLDSLPKNDVEYQYRIRGITPFGEIGPESERVGGKGFQTLDAKASITEAREENGKVIIRWRIIGNKNLIKGHDVERANDSGKTFQRLNDKPLAPETISYIDQSPQSSNYYRVKIIGQNGQSSTSFPMLVQLVDSIPPAQPQSLKVKVDTSGIAKLSWVPNQENDLLGYKVYRSNFSSAEFSQVNRATLSLASYSDSLNIKTLTTKVYYKVAAFDKRMNRSVYSTIVEAELPDIIPPLPPVIREIRPDSKGIILLWNSSSSQDVASYQLERKAKDSSQWRVIKNFTTKDSSVYKDVNVIANSPYQYRIIAIDKSKLKSAPSNVVVGKTLINNQRPPVKNITAQVDREKKTITLQWKYDEKDVSKFLIYRAEGNEAMTLYKTIVGDIKFFVDVNLRMETDYQFRIKCVFKDGSESLFSSAKKIRY